MNTETFGAFLAQARRTRGLTQAELAGMLQVTDKAVSRWERGVGLPDINTLEPLADALGLSLADLMHCRDPQQADASGAGVPLEDFLTMLRSRQPIDWDAVRKAMFWLSLALSALCVLCSPARVAVHFTGTPPTADGWMPSLIFFPLFALVEYFVLEIWNFYARAGLFWKGGEKHGVFTQALRLTAPPVERLLLQAVDFFFFGCAFLVPCSEFFVMVWN